MMFGKKVILLAASLLLAMSLWACSTDFDARDDQAASAADASPVGAGNCIGCHRDADLSTEASPPVISDYLAGNHVIHSTHIDADSGDCLECHDPLGDGRSLENLIEPGGLYAPDPPPAEEYIPLAGLAAVTCENCHGGGGNHITDTTGIPVPYVTPDYNRCGQCHNSDFFHNTYHPEADNIVEDYIDSKHLTGTVRNTAVCVKCHTDEGAIKYKDHDTVGTLTNALPVPEASSIQCRTCHNPHNNSLLLEADTLTDPDPTLQASAEYNTCTNCHQRHDAQISAIAGIQQIPGTATPDGSSGDLIFHAGSWDRVISSTHWDDPATSYQTNSGDQTTNIVEGYAIDPTNPRACRDCHNVHGADATINKQWASSGHGGKIRAAKETAAALMYVSTIEQVAAIRAAGANGADSALPHYDWDSTYKADGDDLDTLPDLDRGLCQKCHTATGAKNFLNAMITLNDADPDNDITYDPANNDFSHLVGWAPHTSTTATVSSGQNELIYCWACHSDNSGTLRNPGGVTLDYSNVAVGPTIPDLGKSNVCVNCHGGRGNMDSYGLSGDPSTPMTELSPGYGTGTKNVTASHYLTAAAIIYQDEAQTDIGYEYAGLSYADPVSQPPYLHKTIGLNYDSPESGSGPCSSCHIEAANHTFSVVEKNTAGVITGLNSTVCITCHDGGHGPAFVAEDTTTAFGPQTTAAAVAFIEEEAEGFHQALNILEQALLAKGLTYGDYPYFSTEPGGSWIDEGTFGAAHNYVLLHHEPGAYVHNRFYTKRLIFDSIDWLDGDSDNADGDNNIDTGRIDGTISIDADSYLDAAKWFGADAIPATSPYGTVYANRP